MRNVKLKKILSTVYLISVDYNVVESKKEEEEERGGGKRECRTIFNYYFKLLRKILELVHFYPSSCL